MRHVVLLSIAVFATLQGCTPEVADRDFRQEMRDFVIAIANQARNTASDFIVIPQNGQELITEDSEPNGPLAVEYAAAIDGQGREDLFYGFNDDNQATPALERDYLLEYLARDEEEGIEVLVTDYCSTPAFMDDSYVQNAARGFASFAADHRELDNIPSRPAAPIDENDSDIDNLSEVQNFLYLINPGAFTSVDDFIETLAATNYDLFIIDAFFGDGMLTSDQVAALQAKANGGRRLVIAYMSIGEAEDYRYYWQTNWQSGSPGWIEEENPDFEGNFKVRYWEREWQDIILAGPDAYLNRIVAAGFDGVYLDLIDAFEYFE